MSKIELIMWPNIPAGEKPRAIDRFQKDFVRQSLAPHFLKFARGAAMAIDAAVLAACDTAALYFYSAKGGLAMTAAYCLAGYCLTGNEWANAGLKSRIEERQRRFVADHWRRFTEHHSCKLELTKIAKELDVRDLRPEPGLTFEINALTLESLSGGLRADLKTNAIATGLKCSAVGEACSIVGDFISNPLNRPHL